MARVTVSRITDQRDLAEALTVLDAVYLKEKNWIKSAEQQLDETALSSTNVSWFLARYNRKPVGVLRLLYDPSFDFPPDICLTLEKGINLDDLAAEHRFVEIGRFCILPEYRSRMLVSLRLMRIAIKEVVERNYSHFITDVFENEPTSPFKFHTKLLGFEVIGKHLYGELTCSCTRIILTLDILKAYNNLKLKNSRIYRSLTYGIRGLLNKKLQLLNRKS